MSFTPLRLSFMVALTAVGGMLAQEPELPFSVAPLTPQEREAAATVQLPNLPSFQQGVSLPGGPHWAPEGRPKPTPLTTAAQAGTRSSTSTTGQFIVHGPDLRTRSALADRCEEIARDLDRLLRTPGNWVVPVVVLIKPHGPTDPPDAAITPQVSQLGQSFHLQLTVPQRSGLKPHDLKRELVRLLLVERMLRQQPAVANERSDLLPNWILTGALEAMDYRHRNRPSAIFAAVLKSGKIYSIEEILGSTPQKLDALSRTLYETSCCALVLALIDQPEGPLRFSRFLASLATDANPEGELLRQWFPALATSESSLNKWWSLQLATLASPSVAEPFDPVETAKRLDEVLTLTLPVGVDDAWPVPTVVAAIAQSEATPTPAPQLAVTSSPPPPASRPNAKPAPPVKPKPAAKVATAPPATKSDSAEPDVEEGEAGEGEMEGDPDRTGFLRRIFRFGRDDKAGDPDQAMAEEEPAKEEKPAKEAPKVEPPPPTEKPKPETQKEEIKKEAPKKDAMPEVEEEVDETKRSLNPLKWFRRDKKEDAEEPEKEASTVADAWIRRIAAADPLIWMGAQRLMAGARISHGRFVQQATPAMKTIAYPIEDYAVILTHPEAKALLQRCSDQLAALGPRANVVFRGVVSGYAAVLAQLLKGETDGIDAQLKALRVKATEALAQGRAVRDHLDWYEASQSTEYTGLFEDYLRLPEQIEEELPVRDDPLSRYLDAVEAEFSE